MGTIDPTTLSRAFDSYSAGLALYARQWLDAESARDVVQEAFIRLMRQPVEPHHVKAWLYRTVRNAAFDVRRSQRRREQRERESAEKTRVGQGPGPWRPSPGVGAGVFDSRPDDLIDAATAAEALARLPDEQRETVTLRIWGGLSWVQIAELTDATVSTAFSRYKAGLAAIRVRMEHPCQTNH
jgi:RNA polymerase sigma factor (sigma-70 family)